MPAHCMSLVQLTMLGPLGMLTSCRRQRSSGRERRVGRTAARVGSAPRQIRGTTGYRGDIRGERMQRLYPRLESRGSPWKLSGGLWLYCRCRWPDHQP